METSTPLPSDMRRRTLIIMANANTSSPLRRSMNASVINTSAVEMTNDEDERADRRSQLQIQKRLSTISSPKAVNLNESFIKEQFVMYTHLFTENKITAKNAWKLQIIDMLKPLCQKSRQDVLQIASTSIDISAKVYGIRVDDVHSEGLKLANNMARVAETAALNANDDEGNNSDGEQEAVTTTKKKKRKRPNQSGVKSTINRNPKGNLGKLPKLEPADFTTRVKSDTGTVDNLFTTILKETPNSFILLDKTRKFIELVDPSVQNEEKISLRNIRLPQKLGSINPTFNDFAVDMWDPEQEEKQLNEEKSLLSQIQPVVFDDKGFPIPELDGSIHDIFENNDADVDMDNDDDMQTTEVQQRHLMRSEIRNGVVSVVDFRPMESTIQSSEYSFNPVIRASSGKYLDQIWAGPSHWKLKFIRRSTPRFSGQNITTKVPQKRRKKNHAEMIDFDSDPPEVDMCKTLIIRKRPPSVDIDKITLPLMDQSCARIMATIKELMLKPGVCPVEKKHKPATDVQEDFEISPYKYENPNDSLYCSQSQSQNHNDDGDMDDNRDMDDTVVGDGENVVPHTGNLAENLIDNPETVPSTYIQYASKAKQIDMKKLKAAIWHKLTTDPETQKDGDKVIPQNFSAMYKALPEIMPSKEKEKLSCPLAFFALLHLANEQILYLKPLEGNKDCHILGPEYYSNL